MLAGLSFDSLLGLVAATAFILAVLWAATVTGATGRG